MPVPLAELTAPDGTGLRAEGPALFRLFRSALFGGGIGGCAASARSAPVVGTVWSLDYRQSGIGSNSCGPELAEAYRLGEKTFTFAVSISPL